MATWINDNSGNRASVERWGSEEGARESLATLKGCSRCSDCSYCLYCSGCSRCSYCSDCSDCSRCSRCSDCSGCLYCSGCSRCSYCSDCSGKANVAPGITIGDVPVIQDIHRKVLEAASNPGALDMGNWHTCDTTHCRAGWVVHLAGQAGYELERQTSPVFAAQQIYKASGYAISPVRFYESNEVALADMKRLAEMEASQSQQK